MVDLNVRIVGRCRSTKIKQCTGHLKTQSGVSTINQSDSRAYLGYAIHSADTILTLKSVSKRLQILLAVQFEGVRY